MDKLKKVINKHKNILCLFFINMFFNCIINLFMEYPIISDEYNIISEGLFLYKNSLVPTAFLTVPYKNYYGFGYSLLFGGLGYFTDNMHIIYVAVLCMNAFFLSLVSIIAYKIALCLGLKSKYAFFLSLVSTFYPAYVIYAKYALNETFLTFLLWSIAYCFILIIKNKNSRQGIVLAALTGGLSMYAYAVHGRGLAILCVSSGLILLLVFTVLKHKLLSTTVYFSTCLVIYFINQGIKGYIAEEFLGIQTENMVNTAENILNPSFFQMLFGSETKEILAGFLGQSFYCVCSTFGLVVVSAVFFIKIFFKFYKNRKDIDQQLLVVFSTFVIGTTGATLVISTLFFANLYVSHGMVRGEYWIYGRYNEVCMGLIVFFALFCLIKFGITKIEGFVSLGITILLLAASIRFVVPRIMELENPRLSYTMVPGIVPFSGRQIYENPEMLNYISLIFMILGIFLLLIYSAFTKKKLFTLCIAGLFFFYSSIYSICTWAFPVSSDKRGGVLESFGNDNEFVDAASKIYVLDVIIPIARIPFFFPENEVVYLNKQNFGCMELADMEENGIILSSYDEKLDMTFDDIYYIGCYDNIYVWIHGSEIEQYFENKGIVLSNRNSENEKLSIHQADLVSPQFRRMKLSDISKEFRYRINSNEFGILTAETAVLSQGGTVTLNDIYLEKGTMCVTLRGYHISYADIALKNAELEILDIMKNGNDEVQYILNVENSTMDFNIEIANFSHDEIRFDELIIEICSY